MFRHMRPAFHARFGRDTGSRVALMAEPRSEAVTRRPAPALAPYVEQYTGYRLRGFPAGVHRGLPSRHLTFIVSIGDPIDVIAQTDPAQAARVYRCVLGGLQTDPALIAHRGDQEGVGIDLTPEGCRALFGLPARALWNTSLELGEVADRTGDEHWERIQAAPTWSERFAICDAVLLRLLDEHRRPLASELRRSWQLLDRTHGALTVGSLAAEVGWTRQHLGRRFSEEFGLSPKSAARLMRFDRARHALVTRPPATSIAEVAAACGYYDQAHLNREFVELARCTPTELLAGDLPSVEDLPSVQDLGEPAGAR
jgi:AraC-like DNA-binding protein